MCSKFPFFQSFNDHSRNKTDHSTRNRSADKQNGEVVCDLSRLCPKARGNDLSDVVEYSANYADGDAGEPIQLFEQDHAE